MTNQKPIEPLPSRELVTSWYEEAAEWSDLDHVHQHIASRAAQWGYEQRGAVNKAELQKARDEELEACCEWVGDGRRENLSQVIALRAARRPKPKSQAEEAIAELDGIATCFRAGFGGDLKCCNIRAALERLRELEKQADD